MPSRAPIIRQRRKTASPVAKPEPQPTESIFKYASVACLLLGFFALFSYFFHIDYFPLFDLQAASSYVFALAYVMFFAATSLSVTFLLPYLILGMVINVPRTSRGKKHVNDKIIGWMLFGALALGIVSISVLAIVYFDLNVRYSIALSATGILLLCYLNTVRLRREFQRKYKDRTARIWKRRVVQYYVLQQVLTGSLTGLMQFLPLWMTLSMVSKASAIADDDYFGLFTLFWQIALVTAVAGGFLLIIVFSPDHRKNWPLGIATLILLPVILTFFAQSQGMLPMSVAHITKIGNFRAEKMILAPKACSSIAPILGINCDEKSAAPIQLCNVHVMSRIGPETYLRVAELEARKDGKFAVRRVLLPTSDVTSMAVDFKLKLLRASAIDDDLSKKSSACESTLTTTFSDAAFTFDDFALSDIGKAQLTQFLQSIIGSPKDISEIKVTGHADQIGTREHNLWLAERRAIEVRLLLERGLKNYASNLKVHASSEGSAKPIIKDCRPAKNRVACEAPNRRVEVEVIRRATPREK